MCFSSNLFSILGVKNAYCIWVSLLIYVLIYESGYPHQSDFIQILLIPNLSMTNYSIIEILANILNKLLKLYKSHQVKEAWLTISLLWRMIHLFNSLIMKWLICNLSL